MMANNILSFAERLATFYKRLAAAPACQTSDEALALLITTLEAVEDEFSGVIKNPTPGLSLTVECIRRNPTSLHFYPMAQKSPVPEGIKCSLARTEV